MNSTVAFDSEKEQFLKEFGNDYGYPNAPKNIDEIRATEFKRLSDGLVYLDHAGATLYSELQMEAIFRDFTTNVYGNPHSQGNFSLSTCDIVGEARQQVLNLCNASPREYKCIFTSGATAALKLVGEAFPWSSQSCFMYTMENHNSVLGIREFALNKGAAAFAINLDEVAHDGSRSSLLLHIQRRSQGRLIEEEPAGTAYNLFAFPSECNFSGVRVSPNLVKIVKEDSKKVLKGSPYCNGSWMVLIDAAKGCQTKPPDLSMYKADFVVISFYKMFGYPTGLGALIVRNDAAKLLRKTYFSGGTVAASIADIDWIKRREGVEENFEDGTISFLGIVSIHHGFKILNTLTVSAISRHASSLATYVRRRLLELRHRNGNNVCTLYGVYDSKLLCNQMGPIISFNLKRPDGSWFGYREVENLASLSGIQLRTGCFCNPGACAKYLGLSHMELLSNIEAGHICWDDHDVLHGKPTGAVRVSFGYMSTFEDARKFLDFITSSFVSLPAQSSGVHPLRARFVGSLTEGLERATARCKVRSIIVYPIKSCSGFTVESWPLSNTGLLHDREWLLESASGEILTQKKVPEMCHLSTRIDLDLGILFVESPRCKDKLEIELKSDLLISGNGEMDLHANRFDVQGYRNKADIWFSQAVGRPCSLLRSSGSDNNSCSNRSRSGVMCRDAKTKMNFVNEAQFLLISEESVTDLNKRLSLRDVQKSSHGPQIQVNPMRFRPNLVIAGGQPYEEDGWRSLQIGNKIFTSMGGCNRCQMINLNAQGGEVLRSNEPLSTLAVYRRVKGKILFGILLQYEDGSNFGQNSDSWLKVGEDLYPFSD